VELIQEAKAAGARLFKACEVLEIHIRTFKRWKAGKLTDARKGAAKSIPRRLHAEERQAIVDVCCSKEYQDLTPYEIHVLLLDIKIYIASLSTFYRVLRDHDLVHFRGNTRKSTTSHKPPKELQLDPTRYGPGT